jgi:GTP-binding protein
MAQTKARPPTFVLFASRPEEIPESYRRYLVNSLRESFDLPGVPLRVTVKSSRNPFKEGEEPAPRDKAPRARPRAAPASEGPKPGAAKPKSARPKVVFGKAATNKAKPAKPKAGNPRGRTQKLARPGVKPKRASRPSSSRRTPR